LYLAQLLRAQGKEQEALIMGQDALAIFERTLGSDHPNTRIVREAWG